MNRSDAGENVLQEEKPFPLLTYHKISAPRQRCGLPEDYVPSPFDIICGRGKRRHQHKGNQRFREIIAANVQRYLKADSKLDKTLVVLSLVERIREGKPVCRFVKLDDRTGQWEEIGDALAREKVGHALRDAITAQKKGSRAGKEETTKNKKPLKQKSSKKKVVPAPREQDPCDDFDRFIAETFLEPAGDSSLAGLDFSGETSLGVPEGLEAAYQPLPIREVDPLDMIDLNVAGVCLLKQPRSSFSMKFPQFSVGEKKVFG